VVALGMPVAERGIARVRVGPGSRRLPAGDAVRTRSG
jgi:hypothetical protein